MPRQRTIPQTQSLGYLQETKFAYGTSEGTGSVPGQRGESDQRAHAVVHGDRGAHRAAGIVRACAPTARTLRAASACDPAIARTGPATTAMPPRHMCEIFARASVGRPARGGDGGALDTDWSERKVPGTHVLEILRQAHAHVRGNKEGINSLGLASCHMQASTCYHMLEYGKPKTMPK